MKKEIIAYIVFVLIVSVGLVVAAKNQEQKQDKEFELPDNTIEVASGVFYFVVTTTTSAEGIVQTTPTLTDEGGDDVIEEPSPEQELNDNDEPHDNEGIEQHLF